MKLVGVWWVRQWEGLAWSVFDCVSRVGVECVGLCLSRVSSGFDCGKASRLTLGSTLGSL